MTELTQFNFQGRGVRVIPDEHGEPWFVAKDVLAILDLNRSSLVALDDDEKGSHSVYTPGGDQHLTIVSESGIYSLVLRSRKNEARAFKRWLLREVLPSIRKTGGYGTAPALTGPALMAAALIEAQATLAATTEQVAALTPRAEAFDAFLSTSGDLSVNEAAKILSRDHGILTGEKRLRDWMQANGWIYRNEANEPRAYQRRIDQGALAERARWHHHPETGERVIDTPQVRVTAKGVEALAKSLTKVVDQGELDVAGGDAA